MPPADFLHRALSRSLLVFTALVVGSIVLVVTIAGAGGVDPQCRGNSPNKICPKLSPSQGATVSGQIAVSADVPSTVVAVQFKLDGSNLGAEDTVAPYSVSWDTTKSSNAQHALTAVARTADGQSSTGESDVTVANSVPDTSAPSVSFTNPASGASVSSQVTVSADASDNVGVVGVQFKLDGSNLGSEDTSSPYSVSWDTTNASNASHTLTAVARDAAGNSSSTQRTVTVSNSSGSGGSGDTTAPSVSFSSPGAGATVAGTVSVAASASDNVGVAGVQFKLDGTNLGSEDTTSPYGVSWDTTNASNGTHTLVAVARDAAGNTASTSRSVDVSNTSSGDTAAPTVSFSSPGSGATVSGLVSVAVTATDNVGVAGVQFKLDGSNLGSEDTTSPYGVAWDTTKVSNGAHTLSAVARDAAGNSATASRSVTVSNTTSGGGGSGPTLAWAPPTLTNPITINVTNANKQLYLDPTRDYRLNITEQLIGKPGLYINGGHNVVVIGGHITMNTAGTSSFWDRTAVKLYNSTGVVHLEGLLIDGAYLSDGIVTASPNTTLQVENVRVEDTHATADEHPDCLQTQAGLGALRIDRFSCSTQLQGLFLSDLPGPVGPCDIRDTNIVGLPGKVLFWQQSKNVGPISLSNVWLYTAQPWSDFGYWTYPNRDGETYLGTIDSSRKAVVSSDGSYSTFIGSNISGRINKGMPSGGDFVPASKVGANYASPGYQ
jgi:Big-like domain-containing protein